MNKKIKGGLAAAVMMGLLGSGLTVLAEGGSRSANITSKGSINYENGTVFFSSQDLINLAGEIDELEKAYKIGTVDALNSIGTYFKTDGSQTYDSSANEADTEAEKLALSFGSIKRGIRQSQSVAALSQIQATDKEGNLLYYEDEAARDSANLAQVTTSNTGYPVYYMAATADNLSAGTAGWVNGVLLKGNGADNSEAYNRGQKDGYTEGYDDGVIEGAARAEISYTYHSHEEACNGECGGTIGGGTTSVDPGTGITWYNGGCGTCGKKYSYDSYGSWENRKKCSVPVNTCGKREGEIESATIVVN